MELEYVVEFEFESEGAAAELWLASCYETDVPFASYWAIDVVFVSSLSIMSFSYGGFGMPLTFSYSLLSHFLLS